MVESRYCTAKPTQHCKPTVIQIINKNKLEGIFKYLSSVWGFPVDLPWTLWSHSTLPPMLCCDIPPLYSSRHALSRYYATGNATNPENARDKVFRSLVELDLQWGKQKTNICPEKQAHSHKHEEAKRCKGLEKGFRGKLFRKWHCSWDMNS